MRIWFVPALIVSAGEKRGGWHKEGLQGILMNTPHISDSQLLIDVLFLVSKVFRCIFNLMGSDEHDWNWSNAAVSVQPPGEGRSAPDFWKDPIVVLCSNCTYSPFPSVRTNAKWKIFSHHRSNVTGHGTHDTAVVDPRRSQMDQSSRQNPLSLYHFKNG